MKDKVILILLNSAGNINNRLNDKSVWENKGCLEEYEYFMSCTSFLPTNSLLRERVFCFMNNLTSIPTCQKCGFDKKFLTKNYSSKCDCQNIDKIHTNCVTCNKPIVKDVKYEGFPYTCSRACINDNENYDQLLINARGYPRGYSSSEDYLNSLRIEDRECNVCGTTFNCHVDDTKKSCSRECALKSPERSEKIKEYQNNNAEMLLEKRKAACLLKYGYENCLESPEIRDKIRQTCNERYGVSNHLLSDRSEQHRREILLEKYGVDNYFKRRDLVVEAWSKKYGVEITSPQQIESVKQKTLDTVRSNNDSMIGCMPFEATAKTCIERYGAPFFFASDAGKMTFENLRTRYGWSDDDIVDLVKRKNNQSKCGRASKESLAYFVPLYNFLLNEGFEDDNILFGYEDKNEMFLSSDLTEQDFIKGFYDFTIMSLKIIIEYHGEKFHPRINLLTEEELDLWENPYSKRRWEEQYLRDEEKKKLAIDNGFNYYELWSSNSREENINIIKSIFKPYNINYSAHF